MEALLDELQTEIPKAFETEDYSRHREQVLQQLEEQRREKLTQIDRHATESGFKLLKGSGGLMLAPAAGAKLLSDEDLERLTVEELEKVSRARDRLQHEIEERLRSVRELEKGIRDALRALDTETAVYVTRYVIEDLRARYHDLPAVLNYLAAVQADVTAHADEFRKGKEQDTPPALAPLMQAGKSRWFVTRQMCWSITPALKDHQCSSRPIRLTTI